MISAQHLQRTYPGKVPVQALQGVTFEIGKGEFVAIMGRSGSGKSTLLHQLGLIDTPTAGTLHIGDTNVLALSDEEKAAFRLERFGYVFQEYALLVEMSAQENVWLPALALGKEPGHCWNHAAQLLELVGLGGRLDHYPNELSGGEMQRVAIARSLINSPQVLFADEPTANLDTASAQVVLELFQKLNRERGQTIVMVTHEPDDKKYVSRVMTLKDGLVESDEQTATHARLQKSSTRSAS
jgi:putative ABC transport system ATP-binding protein